MALKKWFKNKKKNTKRNKLSISKTRKFNKKHLEKGITAAIIDEIGEPKFKG